MNGRTQTNRILLGLKVKQLRQEQASSLAELSKKAGVSVSYLNEIEKGKKYPKEDKLESLAEALNCSYEYLISKELPQKLEPLRELLESNFLNDLPLELFKIELNKIIEIIANAPAQVSAFISTLIELSRNYAVQQESFYFAALRSYLELHFNYFEDLEQEVERFMSIYKIPTHQPVSEHQLAELLSSKFQYKIAEDGLDQYPDLRNLRSIFIPKGRKLLLNSQLTTMQKTFQFGKELGFSFLKLKERANTSSVGRPNSFEEVLNHSKAIYFSTALLINRQRLVEDISTFFAAPTWNEKEFLDIMLQYEASPEMYYHRLTNLLPEDFGIKKIFFIRFMNKTHEDTFEVDRELYLDNRQPSHKNELNEHYCRRWKALNILNDLKHQQNGGSNNDTNNYLVAIQRTKYYGKGEEYLCFTIARSSYPTPNKNVSVTLGLRINDTLKDKVKFWNDPAIPTTVINQTCERCPIEDCSQRVAPPTIVLKRQQQQRIQKVLEELVKG